MRELKGIIAVRKDGTLIEFDNREEYLKEVSSKNYSRIFASPSDIMTSLKHAESSLEKLWNNPEDERWNDY